jgi:glycosyltransferase involved in cell wall biosynthesis
VSESIAEIYRKEYNKEVKVVRNIPVRRKYEVRKTKAELNLPENQHILMLQGTGINIHRGTEELVEAMQYIHNAVLFVIGDGNVVGLLKEMTKKMNLTEKIQFLPRLPFDQLYDYTVHADLGFSLDKDIGINHRFALPNKVFDFIRAEVPVVVSNLVEIRKLVEQYRIGVVAEDHQPENIAQTVNALLSDRALYQQLKKNTVLASEELCWENEETVLKAIYLSLFTFSPQKPMKKFSRQSAFSSFFC